MFMEGNRSLEVRANRTRACDDSMVDTSAETARKGGPTGLGSRSPFPTSFHRNRTAACNAFTNDRADRRTRVFCPPSNVYIIMNYHERLVELQNEIETLNSEEIALVADARAIEDNDELNFAESAAAALVLDRKREDIRHHIKLRDNEIYNIKNEMWSLEMQGSAKGREEYGRYIGTITAMNEESLALQRRQVELLERLCTALCPEAKP